MTSYQKLKAIFKQLSQLQSIQHIMLWDEAVMMPSGAGPDRAQAMAMFNCLLQKMLVTKQNKKLIAAAKLEGLVASWDIANLNAMEKKYKLSACIPARLIEKLTQETISCEQSWRKLRAQNNWHEFLPAIKRVFKLVQEVAKRRGDVLQLSPYDALLDEYAPGFSQQTIDPIFADLKQKIPAITQRILNKQANEVVIAPVGPFAIEQQKQLGLKAMRLLGFDFERGRLDVSHHPFCGGNPTDVRITTRYNENEFFSSLSGVCHETGHGRYEQGLPAEWLGQPVGEVNSMAMHESQSLLIESLVCNSHAFFEFILPDIKQQFGQQDAFTADNLYKYATRVKPNLIRVDADEVTYQMHIILHYEIEKKLFNSELAIVDLPEYWNEMMEKHLGMVTKGNNKDGVMQDVHWPSGAFGYFPAYTLGRLISAQLFAAFMVQSPQFFTDLAAGNFQALNKWLHENVYLYASSLTTSELLVKATGKSLDADYFIRHVERRYLEN